MQIRKIIAFFVIAFLFFTIQPANAADLSLPKDTPVKVYFSPKGGCTEAIINEIDQAKTEILVQAYSFTSAPIAKALVGANKRGAKIRVIRDMVIHKIAGRNICFLYRNNEIQLLGGARRWRPRYSSVIPI